MPQRRVPKYSLHAPSGQAYVRIQGRMIYLGKHGSRESHEAYARLIAELASSESQSASSAAIHANDLTVVELGAAYLRHAKEYYRKNGQPSPWLTHIRLSIRRLCELYGASPASEFGPLKLKAFRQTLIEAGHPIR